MSKRSVLTIAFLVLATGAIVVVLGPGTSPPDEPPAAPSEPAAEQREAASARLAGRAPEDTAAHAPEPAGPWIAALRGADPARQAEATAHLRARVKAGDLSLDELLDLALLSPAEGPVGLLTERALGALTERGPAALPLLPRLLDLFEAGAESERKVAGRVVQGIAGAYGYGALVAFSEETGPRLGPAELRPYLARIHALVRNEDVRLAVLPLVHALAGEAGGVAPDLVAWIQEIERSREEFRRANPNIHVSWHHTEFTIAEVLSRIGAPALPAILDALDEEDVYGEYSLQMAIREMGPDALEALKGLLLHADPEIRAEALVAVAANTEGEADTFAILRAALRDPAPDVRAAAVRYLRPYGADAAPDLVAALSDADEDVRQAAARAMADVPEAASAALPQLLAMLASKDYGEQLSTLSTLEKLGPAAVDATPRVLALLADNLESEHLRDMFSDTFRSALIAFGPGALPAILDAAGGEDASLRRAAVDTLLHLPDVDADDLAPLAGVLPGLGDVDRMRLAAALAAHQHPAATRTLVAGLASEDRETRTAAAEGLQHAGPSAADALPLLVQGLRENHERLHADGANWSQEWDPYYAFSLAVVHVGSQVPAELLPLLGDETDDVADAAGRGFTQAGERGVAVLDAHWTAIPPKGRARLVGALAKAAFADPPSETARALLESCFEDADASVRLVAARAVGGREELLPRAVLTYIALLSASEGKVAQDAAYRLRKLGAKLAPWEAELRAAQPKEPSTARTWVQDALDLIEASR